MCYGREVNSIKNRLVLLLGLTTANAAFAQTIGPIQSLSTSPSSASQRSPSALWDGQSYILVWEEDRNDGNGKELFWARMDNNGQLLTPNAQLLLGQAVNNNQSLPKLALNSSAQELLVTWADSRSSATQVYGTRVSLGTNGQSLDGTGFAVTNGASYGYPSVDCISTRCMFLYRKDAGGELEFRRMNPDGTFLDASSQDLVQDSLGQTIEQSAVIRARSSDFAVIWEDDRNGSNGILGSDLFWGSIAASGNVPAISGQTLVSANLRQTAPSVAYASNSNELWVTWQDQRQGNLDVWFSRFNSLSSTLNQAAISAGPDNEVFPSLGYKSTGSVLVWEDFRTAYGSIYGSTLDPQGALQTPKPFPILAFLGNAIEQIVIPGPGNDFLVLAVQSNPAPAKIYYRIIRNEAPSGSSTLPVVRAPADGISTAVLSFGPYTSAPSFNIVDNTLFTLNLPNGVTPNVSDEDPNRAGIQVSSVNGRVQFGISSTQRGVVTVSISSVLGTATGTGMVEFENVAPTVNDVEISPAVPNANDDLVLTYAYTDPNQDPEGATEITWTSNGITQSSFDNLRTIPASATNPSQVWRALVRPSDGQATGSIGLSNAVTIGPAPGNGQGSACQTNSDCLTGFCVDNVCCENQCGNSARDCQACSVAAGSSTNGRCEITNAGTQCRAAAGLCDRAEVCNGISPSCPADTRLAAGTSCRSAVGNCDIEESCNGVSPFCPADQIFDDGTPCRGRMGVCDESEVCDGVSAFCPEDQKVMQGTVCRAASGPCDTTEVCDGLAPTCPGDEVSPQGIVCRAASGDCDEEEVCDGENARCPINLKKVQGEICRASKGDCDYEEVCDGFSFQCPDDIVLDQNSLCRASSGDCDKPEYCDGASVSCPVNKLASSDVICRDAMDTCDAIEYCDGTSIDCPNDSSKADGSMCDDNNRCSGDDICMQGECKGQTNLCSSPPDSAPPSGLPPASEPKSILSCKCKTNHQPRQTSLVYLGLIVGFLLIRPKRAASF